MIQAGSRFCYTTNPVCNMEPLAWRSAVEKTMRPEDFNTVYEMLLAEECHELLG